MQKPTLSPRAKQSKLTHYGLRPCFVHLRRWKPWSYSYANAFSWWSGKVPVKSVLKIEESMTAAKKTGPTQIYLFFCLFIRRINWRDSSNFSPLFVCLFIATLPGRTGQGEKKKEKHFCGLTSIICYPVDIDRLFPLGVLKHCFDLITVAVVGHVISCKHKRKCVLCVGSDYCLNN